MRPYAPLVLAAAVLLLAATAPTHADSSAKARGAELFATKGCVHCHGTAGVNGEIGPDLQQVRNRLSAAQITTQIHDGGKGMPAFGDQLSEKELADLVAYLRTKRKVIIPPPAPQP
jgi:mono/diheme cytochrome c family protein